MSRKLSLRTMDIFLRLFACQEAFAKDAPSQGFYLFLAVEILAIKIRSSNSLEGILIGSRNKCVKISQYADDGILYINSKEEICCALNILSDFGRVAGVILNVTKCEGLWFENSVIRQFNNAAFWYYMEKKH